MHKLVLLRHGESKWNKKQKELVDSKSVQAVRENIPFSEESFDLILVHAAMPAFESKGTKMKHSINKSYDEIVRILKQGGEALLYPITHNTKDEHRIEWEKETRQKLKDLADQNLAEVSFKKIQTNDSVEDEFVVIIKKL